MIPRMRILGPASVAMFATVLVWVAVSAADPLDSLYALNMATRASTYGFLFIGAAAGAFAALNAGIARRHASSRLADASGSRGPLAIALDRLKPVISWFTAALTAVIAGAALLGGGPVPMAQVAVVVVAAVASLWLAIALGAAAGRYLPLGLGPLCGLVSTYALYVPAVLSGGRGPWAVVPIMDVHPAPQFFVRPGAYLLGALLLAACAVALVSFAGPRAASPVVPVGAVVVGVVATLPLQQVSPRVQDEVFLGRADTGTVCTSYDGSLLCVLRADDRFLETLTRGAVIAWPVLQKYSIEPDRISQVDASDAGSASTTEVDVRSLAAGPEATAVNIINSVVATSCGPKKVDPRSGVRWEVILGAALTDEVGLVGEGLSGGESVEQLASLPSAEREQRIREVLASLRAC